MLKYFNDNAILLQAILSRKLNVPEIHELMKKVEEMSITADSPHVRRECRQVGMSQAENIT